VAVTDADMSNVGFFFGLRQASDPDRKFDFFRPVPVVFAGSSGKATLEPTPGSCMIRLATTKQVKLAPGGFHRLY
jgi:hypothetical protein